MSSRILFRGLELKWTFRKGIPLLQQKLHPRCCHGNLFYSFHRQGYSNHGVISHLERVDQCQTVRNKRCFSSQSGSNSYDFDPQKEPRRKKLMTLTYISGFIGICLLTAIGIREYKRLKYRARGMEEVKIRQYGRRPVMYRYRGFVLPDFAVSDIEAIHSFEVKEDDVWVVSFPKSGTTWLQEIVYLIMSDLDFETAKTELLDERFPYFEFPYPGISTLAKKPSPRFFKTHIPLSLLPNQVKVKKPKILYITRNPKDTVVSFYHFSMKFIKNISLRQFQGTFDEYCQLFTEDLVDYGPWWKHVKEAWQRKDSDNMLFLFYEDLQKDVLGTIKQIGNFLGKNLTDEEVRSIAHHCSFSEMKDNKSVNYNWMKDYGIAHGKENFFRKGKVGDWKNHLSQEIVTKIDEMVAVNLTPVGVVFQDTMDDTSEKD